MVSTFRAVLPTTPAFLSKLDLLRKAGWYLPARLGIHPGEKARRRSNQGADQRGALVDPYEAQGLSEGLAVQWHLLLESRQVLRGVTPPCGLRRGFSKAVRFERRGLVVGHLDRPYVYVVQFVAGTLVLCMGGVTFWVLADGILEGGGPRLREVDFFGDLPTHCVS